VFLLILPYPNILQDSLILSYRTNKSQVKHVSLNLPYLRKDDLYLKEKPYTTDFSVDHIPGAKATNHLFDFQRLVITDAQERRDDFSLQKNGFCFLRRKTSATYKYSPLVALVLS
jgi:hypothetical protein